MILAMIFLRPIRRTLGAVALLVGIGTLSGNAQEADLYRIELEDNVVLIARTRPAPQGSRLVFTRYPDGALLSLKRSSVRRVDPVSNAEASNYRPGGIGPTGDRATAGAVGRANGLAGAGAAPSDRAFSDARQDQRTGVQTIPSAPAPTPPSRSDRGPFTFAFHNVYLLDDNINHSRDDPHETLEATWKTPVSKPNFEISYEIARHFHTADEWDRLSHDVRAAWEQRLSKHWNVETVGEVSLKGSTEDRDISDQYIFSPRLEYRFTRENRVRAYGAYRIRKFDEDPTRDARNRYAGIEYVYRGGVRRADVGFRYEVNRADSDRHHYTRWSYYADYTVPVGRRNRITLEANYRPRRYDVRTVRVGDHRELRLDKSWILAAGVGHLLRSDLEIFAGYRFENRTSNDPDKRFNERSAEAGLAYRF
jgi:hypothetical protein